MSPRLVREVKKHAGSGINIIDSSPGTACPAAEAVRGVDLVVLVTDPTPFGLNDLKLAVQMTRKIGTEPVVLVNRAGFDDAELREYCREEGLDIIAEIPDDRRIAEVYSTGGLVFEELEQYRDLFKSIASKIEELSRAGKRPRPPLERDKTGKVEAAVNIIQARVDAPALPREVVVISGKGGTGKTSIAAAFASLASPIIVADCDVDAPDLHLLLRPSVREKGLFRGGFVASIDQSKCTSCGQCYQSCRFEAIEVSVADGRKRYSVDPMACEGCGVCALLCPETAIEIMEVESGQVVTTETKYGFPVITGRLNIGESGSGKIVAFVKAEAKIVAKNVKAELILVDGPPGVGCPVISAMSGAHQVIAITEPTPVALHDLDRVLSVAKHFNLASSIVLNKANLHEETRKAIIRYAEERGKEKASEHFIFVIKNIVKGIVALFALLFLLNTWGVDLSGAVVGLGVSGIVIGFALQNVLADFFSAFSIYFDRPFEVGDFIIVGDYAGTVTRITLKSTRIKLLQGEELVLPNKELTSTSVRNFKKMRKRRVVFTFGVTYDTPLEKLKKIPGIIEDIINSDKLEHVDKLDRVHFTEFGDFSLNFEVVYYLNTKDYTKYRDTQQAINFAIKEAFEKEGIEMAFPTQTIYLYKAQAAG